MVGPARQRRFGDRRLPHRLLHRLGYQRLQQQLEQHVLDHTERQHRPRQLVRGQRTFERDALCVPRACVERSGLQRLRINDQVVCDTARSAGGTVRRLDHRRGQQDDHLELGRRKRRGLQHRGLQGRNVGRQRCNLDDDPEQHRWYGHVLHHLRPDERCVLRIPRVDLQRDRRQRAGPGVLWHATQLDGLRRAEPSRNCGRRAGQPDVERTERHGRPDGRRLPHHLHGVGHNVYRGREYAVADDVVHAVRPHQRLCLHNQRLSGDVVGLVELRPGRHASPGIGQRADVVAVDVSQQVGVPHVGGAVFHRRGE